MDIQLQELIDKIKKDGIEKASADAARAKAEAEAESRRIIDAAKKEAEGIVAKARVDAERFEKSGAAALQQASRNLVLAFKAEIDSLLETVIRRETAGSYSDEALKAAIPEVLKAWSSKGSDSLELLLPADALSRLEAYFNEKLKAELKKGVTLKGERSLGAGFKIAAKDGSAYYDFSSDSVAGLLSSYLNPRLAEILKAAAKGN